MECNLQTNFKEEFAPLPVTPSKPPLAKKPTFSQTHTDSAFRSDDAVRSLANLINSRSNTLEQMMESVRSEIKVRNEKIVHIEKRVEKNEESALKTMNRVSDLERCSRHWNLRLHGVPEAVDEDVRARVMSICQGIPPVEKEKLPDAIDVAHRVGKPRQDDQSPCVVWKAAKNSSFLKNKGLHFTEDLSKEDKENCGP